MVMSSSVVFRAASSPYLDPPHSHHDRYEPRLLRRSWASSWEGDRVSWAPSVCQPHRLLPVSPYAGDLEAFVVTLLQLLTPEHQAWACSYFQEVDRAFVFQS